MIKNYYFYNKSINKYVLVYDHSFDYTIKWANQKEDYQHRGIQTTFNFL